MGRFPFSILAMTAIVLAGCTTPLESEPYRIELRTDALEYRYGTSATLRVVNPSGSDTEAHRLSAFCTGVVEQFVDGSWAFRFQDEPCDLIALPDRLAAGDEWRLPFSVERSVFPDPGEYRFRYAVRQWDGTEILSNTFRVLE